MTIETKKEVNISGGRVIKLKCLKQHEESKRAYWKLELLLDQKIISIIESYELSNFPTKILDPSNWNPKVVDFSLPDGTGNNSDYSLLREAITSMI